MVPTVLHQLLDLQIDTEAERLCGSAELQVEAPADVKQIGLDSLQLVIDKVEVDGSQAEFELQPYLQGPFPAVLDSEESGQSKVQPQAINELANDCFYQYKGALEKEDVAELTINLPPAATPMQTADPSAAVAHKTTESTPAPAGKDPLPKEPSRAMTVRIEFHLDKPQYGMRFHSGYACSDNQVRRARSWFPCLDIPSAVHSWALRFTVRAGQVAVGPGQLLKQTWNADRAWLTYHYAVEPRTPPCHIGLAVGPLAKLPLAIPRHVTAEAISQKQASRQQQSTPHADGSPNAPASPSPEPMVLTVFAPPDQEKYLRHAAHTTQSALLHMSSVLAEDMPLRYLQQAFVPAEIAPVGGMQLGLGLIIMSADVLVDPTAVEQAMDAQVVMAEGIAQQWMGVLMQASPGDEWVTTGLAAWLLSKYIGICFGNNEQQYRQWSEREAVYALDSGHAAPLACKHARDGPWGGLHGTEQLSPALLSTWKASVLMSVLEARIGKDGFRHVVELLTTDACSFLLGRPTTTRSSTAGRMLSTGEFLKAIAKEGALKKEMGYFNNFCVKGRGYPSVTAAYDFATPVKKKRDDRIAEFALRLQASSLIRKSLTATNQGLGHLKLTIREDQDTINSLHIPLPTSGPLLIETKMPARKPGYRPRHKKRKASAIDADEGEDGDGDAENADDALAESTLDVAWMAMEPHSAWVRVKVLQTERTCIAQLEHAHDLPIQLSAIETLQGMKPLSYAGVSALKSCLTSPNTFCRVQIEAAAALGATASAATGFAGLEHLITFYRDKCCERVNDSALDGMPMDAAAFVQKAYGPAELATYLVLQAVPGAVACVRDQRGVSPVAATDFLLTILDQGVPQGGRLYDERATTAAFVAALGACHPSSSEVLQRAVAQLETCLSLEAAMPGSDDVITCAALSSLTALACLPPLASHLISRLPAILMPPRGPCLPVMAATSEPFISIQPPSLPWPQFPAVPSRIRPVLIYHVTVCA